MANRYWVGGTATWNGTAGTKWALTSGGAGGQAVPTSSDDVFIDSFSNGSTITNAPGTTYQNLDCTGFTGSLDFGSSTDFTGSVTLGAGLTFVNTPTNWTYTGAGASTFTCNGVVSAGSKAASLLIQTASGSLTFADNFTLGITVRPTQGGLDTNGKTVTCESLFSDGALTRSLTLGASTITIGATGFFRYSGSGLTLSAGTSTVKFLRDASTFAGNGLTYNNVWFAATSGTTGLTVTGANTFNDFKDTGTNAHTITLPASATTTVTTFNVNGSNGSLISLVSSSSGTAATLSCASGTINSSYVSIKDSTATGGATFTASNATNVSGNTGWTFVTTPGAFRMFAVF